MAEYTVSARKYRPRKFSEVVGQETVTTTLRNAIKTGKIAHAYLFAGPRGVGKTTCARIFAKTINCENPTPEGEACDQCESCRAFNEGRSFNVHELDAASNNSVEDIRKLIEQVRIPPQIGKYSVYIIDEVHMLSQAAFNAFLKTLEEPPKHAIFIMATTEKHKILPTILSRCQVFDFQRIKVRDIVAHLKKIAQKEGIYAEDDALTIIALKADGALRDALSIFDQLVSFTNGHLTYQKVIQQLNVLDYDYYFRLTDHFLDGNYKDVLLIFDEILQKGFDAQIFLNGLAEHFRNLLIVRTPELLNLLEVGENIKAKYQQQVKKTTVNFLLKALDIINQFDIGYKTAQNKRLHVELALLKLSQLNQQLQQEQQPQPSQQQPQKTTTQPQTKAPTESTQSQEKQLPLSERIRRMAAAQTQTKSTESSFSKIPSISSAVSTKTQVQSKISTSKPTTTSQPSTSKTVKPETSVIATQQTTKSVSNIESKPTSEINLQKITALWEEMEKLVPENKQRLKRIFKNYKPYKCEDKKVYVKLPNQILKEELHKYRSSIIRYISKKTGINVDLVLEVGEVKSQRKPVTPEEKYQYLLQKNPKLKDFTQKFDLEF